jgi:uncharacterized protein YceK
MRMITVERRNILTVLCVVLAVMVSGCSVLRSRDTSSDTVTIPRTSSATDTKHEACVRACSRDHDTCNDGPASRNETFDAPQTIVGAGAACDQSLRDCLKYCK